MRPMSRHGICSSSSPCLFSQHLSPARGIGPCPTCLISAYARCPQFLIRVGFSINQFVLSFIGVICYITTSRHPPPFVTTITTAVYFLIINQPHLGHTLSYVAIMERCPLHRDRIDIEQPMLPRRGMKNRTQSLRCRNKSKNSSLYLHSCNALQPCTTNTYDRS